MVVRLRQTSTDTPAPARAMPGVDLVEGGIRCVSPVRCQQLAGHRWPFFVPRLDLQLPRVAWDFLRAHLAVFVQMRGLCLRKELAAQVQFSVKRPDSGAFAVKSVLINGRKRTV